MSEGGEGRTEIAYLRWFRKLASDEQSRTSCRSEFQMVGAEMRKAHEPSERLWRGTVSSLAEKNAWFEEGYIVVEKTCKIWRTTGAQRFESINQSIIKLTTYTNSDQWFTIEKAIK